MSLRVTLIGTGSTSDELQDSLKEKIERLEHEYRNDGFEAALFHDDDEKSAHALTNNNSISGVRVVKMAYNQASGAEYATQRTCDISLEADYPVPGANNLSAFSETLRIVGNGGPRRRTIETLSGPVQKQIVNKRTRVTAVQSGMAMGYLAYPWIYVPGPYFSAALRRRSVGGCNQVADSKL